MPLTRAKLGLTNMINDNKNNIILSVKNLSVKFNMPSGKINAVKSIDFDVECGKTLAIVGSSGSGKSVAALSILQLLPYPIAEHNSKSSIKFNDDEIINAPKNILRHIRGNRIAMIFQEPMSSLNPLHTIEKQISETLIIHQNIKGDKARARVVELLQMVGIRDIENRLSAYPHELSGGQRQRVMIAMALANDPDILIADEPTTALDVTIQAEILRLLKDLQKKLGMAIIFITHDLNILHQIADKICVMKDGSIVEYGSLNDIFYTPKNDYTRSLITAQPRGQKIPVAKDSPLIVETNDLKVWFPIKKGVFRMVKSHVKAVDGVDLKIRQGETLGVVGSSGSGKTTLGLAILRLISSNGYIKFCGQPINALSEQHIRPMRCDMQIVFQDPFGSLSPRMSIGDIIAEGLKIHVKGKTDAQYKEMVLSSLKEVKLDGDIINRYPHEFSGGQRQRIAIARALILKPKLIILDEPTSALDMMIQADIIDLLRDLQVKYKLAYMFISHDLKTVRAMADNICVMRDGKIIETGNVNDIFDNPREEYTKNLMAAAIGLEKK